jgi:short-subunit dehydrogenase
MKRTLRDRVVAITGASSGIGAATALECARAGMHVVLAARREERLEAVARQVRDLGRRALVVRCDVRNDADVEKLVAATLAEFGRLDVMFANAGYGLTLPVADTTDRQMRDIFETNYYGTLRAVRAALPPMRARHDGHIVICSSAASEIAPPRYGAYAATKAAQDAIACALRAEVAGEGIFVTSVHPIGTHTEFFAQAAEMSNGVIDPNGGGTPVAVRQSPEHVARCIVRGLRRPRAEVWPNPWSRLGIAVVTAFPGLGARALRRMMRRATKEE